MDLVLDVAVDLGIRRDRHVGFGEADLQNDEERQHEEQEQPDERHADHHVPPLRGQALEGSLELAQFHDRSTTPLSSSHQTYTSSPQVGRVPWRSALATKDWTTLPLGSST
ncbi:hypothetical protein D3C73_1491100 [compost metagenome]